MNNVNPKPFLHVFTLILCFPSFLIHSANIFVNGSASGANNGTSWSDAYTDLKVALDNAQANDNVYVAAGTYTPTSLTSPAGRIITFTIKNGVKVYGGFLGAGNPGSRGGISTLSGDIGTVGNPFDNSYTVVYMEDVDINTILDGFTISGGYANGTGRTQTSGGGLLINTTVGNTSAPIISDCIFSGNTCVGDGGGVFVGAETLGSNTNPTFIACSFNGNSAGQGGGLYNSANSGTINMSLDRCDFNGNSANSTGGGLYNFSATSTGSCNTTASNSIFRFNSSGGGSGSAAGFYCLASDSGSETYGTVVNCVFYYNESNTGGAVYVNEADGATTIATVSNSIITVDPSSSAFSPYFHFTKEVGSATSDPEIILQNSIVGAINCSALAPGLGNLTCGLGIQFSTDPLFVNPGTNFNLQNSSPAIDAGNDNYANAIGLTTDYTGINSRFLGTVDIGIYESLFGGALPIELTSFMVYPEGEEDALLVWTTATEIDNDFFTIEHSTDGIRYYPIAEVLGSGTSTDAQKYSFIDHEANVGLNYYRLKQTDFDGTFAYGPIRTITITRKSAELSLYPNPVYDVMTLNLGGTAEDRLNYIIYDWAGRSIQSGVLNNSGGFAQIDLNLNSNLAAGVYFLRVEGFEETQKFVKQ